MRFSVLIPVYNVEKYISSCIESVLTQSYQDYEIILVDDGSTDGSGSICLEYRDRNPDLIQVYRQENRGLLIARRTTIDKARGDYCICLDADDMLHPKALETINKVICQTGVDIVMYQASHKEDYTDKVFSGAWVPSEQEGMRTISIHEFRRMLATSWDAHSMWGKAIKTTCVRQGSDYSEYGYLHMSEDWLQMAEIADQDITIAAITDVLYFYRQNPGSESAGLSKKNLEDALRVKSVLAEKALRWDASLHGFVLANMCFEYAIYLLKAYRWLPHAAFLSEVSKIASPKHFDTTYQEADFSQLATWKRGLIWTLKNTPSHVFAAYVTCLAYVGSRIKPEAFAAYVK